jgi:putative membrane protein
MSMPDLSTAGKPSTSTELAWARTNLAYERTLMAWVRTATSLITFGFTVFKFFQFEAGRSAAPRVQLLLGPRGFAIVMISIGLVALALAAIQRVRWAKQTRAQGIGLTISTATIVAALISVLGLLSLFQVVFDL